MSESQPLRITVKGSLHLGRELELVETAQPPASSGSFFDAGRPFGMAVIDYDRPTARPGQLAAQQLDYSLANTAGNLSIDDAGLCTSYGIFGAPGSGKTYGLLYLLRQILALHRDDQDLKYGALILDPKAVLIDEVTKLASEADRLDDLIILNTDKLMEHNKAVNVIDCALTPTELGYVLVLAAQSTGVSASDPFWFLAWGNLFSSALYLLNWLEEDVVTLRRLLDAILFVEESSKQGPERLIQRLAREGRSELAKLPRDKQRDAKQAINMIDSFFRQDYVATIEAFISKAFGMFQQSRFDSYSPEWQSKAFRRTTFYDQIIDEGKIVLVSVSPSDPGAAKILCTLVKCLFQQSVLSRFERVRAKSLQNFKRPLVLACDEFSQVASEVPGQPMGDGNFFSLARQNGCMGLLATQSVNVLQASSLKDAWRSVFSNFGAKIFMRLVDNETTEEATKLAGKCDWYISSQGASHSKDGMGSSTQKDLRERDILPTQVLTQVLQLGEAVVIGSLDGSVGKASVRFVRMADTSKLPDTAERNAHV